MFTYQIRLFHHTAFRKRLSSMDRERHRENYDKVRGSYQAYLADAVSFYKGLVVKLQREQGDLGEKSKLPRKSCA
jgi:hypothetical protein